MSAQGGIKVRGRVYLPIAIEELRPGDVVRVLEGAGVRWRRVLAVSGHRIRVELHEHERGRSRFCQRGDVQRAYRWRKEIAA